MIGPGLLWFNRFRICMENVRLYLRDAEGSPLRLVWVENGLSGAPPRALAPAPPLGLAGAGACSRLEPKENVLLTRMLSMIWPGPRPKLRGRRVSPGPGLGSSSPYGVRT